MRVVAHVPNYPPLSRVGAWVATHAFLADLAHHGHHVDVFTTYGRGPSYVLDDVNVGPGTNPVALETAIALADVVVTHAGGIDAGPTLAHRWHKPHVVMAHGRIADPTVLAGANLVVFNSANLAASSNHPGPSVVCHPPVIAARYATTPGQHVTLVNLSEPKGGELFWRLARCSTRRFLAVKGGYGIQYLDELANVETIANTPNMRDDVYARTRILLMPSEAETWGMTAIEAAASGIPTIAHPTAGLIESLGDAGVFVDRANGAGWLTEIERLHDPTEWAVASAATLARSAALNPTGDLDRFRHRIEQMGESQCVS